MILISWNHDKSKFMILMTMIIWKFEECVCERRGVWVMRCDVCEWCGAMCVSDEVRCVWVMRFDVCEWCGAMCVWCGAVCGWRVGVCVRRGALRVIHAVRCGCLRRGVVLRVCATRCVVCEPRCALRVFATRCGAARVCDAVRCVYVRRGAVRCGALCMCVTRCGAVSVWCGVEMCEAVWFVCILVAYLGEISVYVSWHCAC